MDAGSWPPRSSVRPRKRDIFGLFLDHVPNLPLFAQVTTTPQLFRWLDEVFLPAQFAQRGYRGWPLPWRRRRYMDDAVSYRIGPARLRQLRMTPGR